MNLIDRHIPSFLLLMLGFFLMTPSGGNLGAQSVKTLGATRFFGYYGLDGSRRTRLCLEVDSADALARSFGVRYDSAGRPEAIYRLFFGNLDSRAEWTIMRLEYSETASGGLITSRTWHAPNGTPLQIGVAHGEQVLYDSSGTLRMIMLTDIEGNRVERVNAVTAQIFRPHPEGGLIQEWRYANNKQFNGAEPDIWQTQTGPVSEETYFRHLTFNELGDVRTERPLALTMEQLTFPDGSEVRYYERNECGMPTLVEHRRLDGTVMENRQGVARIRFEYNDRGAMVRWSAFDSDDEPAEMMGRAVTGVREYRDFDGKLIGEKLFDRDGAPVTAP